jgi:hypothetical protein
MRCLGWICMLLLGGISAVFAQELSSQNPISCELEADCLEQLQGLAKREGNVLTLRLETGKSKTFQSNAKACEDDVVSDCVRYELRAYRPDRKAYVVGYSLYEGGGAVIVSARSAHTTVLASLPDFSPNGQFFVSADSDPHFERGYEIAIWSFTSDRPKQEFIYKTPKTRPDESWEVLGWDGNSRINLKVGILSRTYSLEEFETSIVLTERGWKLHWPLRDVK